MAAFLTPLLEQTPSKRATAAECLQHDWLTAPDMPLDEYKAKRRVSRVPQYTSINRRAWVPVHGAHQWRHRLLFTPLPLKLLSPPSPSFPSFLLSSLPYFIPPFLPSLTGSPSCVFASCKQAHAEALAAEEERGEAPDRQGEEQAATQGEVEEQIAEALG